MLEKGLYFELIVALGNPGKEYAETRHNAGFIVADELCNELSPNSSSFETNGANVKKIQTESGMFYLLKPLKYMNLSGGPVASFIAAKKIPIEKMLVIHDEMDIPLGQIKFSFGAGAAGHKGVQSIIESIGNSANFARLRIGIGKAKPFQGADHVLSKFSDEEKEIFKKTVELCVSAVRFAVDNGINAAMNKFNRKTTVSETEN